jgi:hypothetical protein
MIDSGHCGANGSMCKARRLAAEVSPAIAWCRIAALATAVVAAAQLALFGYFLWRTAIASPISDMFTYIADYLRFRSGETSLPAYLWHAHGEHHLLWIRLLTWADVEMFHTRGTPFMAAATAAITATAALLWWQLRRALPRPATPASLALLAPMLILSAANVTDVSVPINTTYPLTVFFVIAALVLFAGQPDSNSNGSCRRLAAMAAALAASFATAAGLLAWPILFWIAWRNRLARAWLAALAAVGVVYAVLYAQNLDLIGLAPALQKGADPFVSAVHLRKLTGYFFDFLGLPFTRAPALAAMGRAVGTMLFGAGLTAILIASFSCRLSTPLDRIAVGLILLAFGSAALAAVGRADLAGEAHLPVRYTLFATTLQAGLLCLALPRLARRCETPRGRLLLGSAGLVLAVLLLIQQVIVGRAAAQIAAAIAREADCFAGGPLPPDAVGPVVSRSPAPAQAVLNALRREGLLAARDCPPP